MIIRYVPSRRLSLAFVLCLPTAGPGAAAPSLETPADVARETKTAIEFALRAKGDDGPFRYAIVRVRMNNRDVFLPTGMTLAADRGAFAWTPTPSQAGDYDVTFAVRDAKDREATATVRLTVQPRPICVGAGLVGDWLRKWYAEGTAAGNTGDFYDNRDRDHSALNFAPYPQLDIITYTAEERKQRIDWAMKQVIVPAIVFGNSSTSAAVTASGSNPRTYYAHPQGLPFLYQEYRHNNIYIYPAHHDHHPGHNGKPFYGDVFPANSPYLIISQGSSGSDQPFMRAVPFTLAAFRPEVKKKLAQNGLLMPTVQMILRSSNKHLTDPRQYLTGKAHPPVFEGGWVNDLKMIHLAHAMQADNLPPMIQLKVVEEDAPVAGRDYFEDRRTETLADTPAVIARIVRGTNYVRRMVVSAEESFDLNKKPLTFHWAVLRGDTQRIQIKPLNAAGSVVELRVPYHERRPVPDAPLPIESNRVDIGAFVHNGSYYSAPGFITFFSLDHEARTYDAKGRLLEIGYGAGDADFSVADWNGLFEALKPEDKSLPTRLLKMQLRAPELAALIRAGKEYRAASARQKVAQEKHRQVAEAAKQATAEERPKAEEARKAAQQELDAANRAVDELLNKKRPGFERPIKDTVIAAFERLRANPNFAVEHRQDLADLLAKATDVEKGRYHAARKRLIDFGILTIGAGNADSFRSIRAGTAPLAERLTRYERNLIERFNAEVLCSFVYPTFLRYRFKINLVDPRLATLKPWRDVYRYDAAGERVGWKRFSDGGVMERDRGVMEFNAAGQVILEKDSLGRPIKVRAVRYEVVVATYLRLPQLRQLWDRRVVFYEYADANDRKGKVKKEEMVKEKQ